MDDAYDVYPILHREKIYNLITAIDLTFVEVRSLIDYLEEQEAFGTGEHEEAMESGRLYSVELDDVVYEVDVLGYEIAIYSRVERHDGPAEENS
ncbi:MAG: hypothetical protein GTN70_07815 [Deltaproteobacteria bacterium]|nr:hypothetical protein [Deltaproteobacteria bacterium]NIS77604.1 hypothetical protein [Deltaproteobacteria bacterium]